MEQVFHFSAPGRVELGGNHTDHQHGCVLAAAVDLETSADVRLTGGGSIRVLSEGYAPVEIPLRDLAPRPEECGTTAALVRGVAAAFAARGAALGGLEVHVCSDVAPGSGLSSSAAFEVLLARVLNALFCGGRLILTDAQVRQKPFERNDIVVQPMQIPCHCVVGNNFLASHLHDKLFNRIDRRRFASFGLVCFAKIRHHAQHRCFGKRVVLHPSIHPRKFIAMDDPAVRAQQTQHFVVKLPHRV